jgi:hypothetical protein
MKNRLTPTSLDKIKNREVPRGGEQVSIPPLDAKPVVTQGGGGAPMSQQAELLRDPANPLSPRYDPRMAAGQMPPQGPGSPPGARKPQPLSRETVEGLDALNQFNEAARKEVEEGSSAALKEQVDKGAPKEVGSEVEDFLEELQKGMAGKQDKELQELREAIEARCEPLSLEQLLEDGELRQDVPIVRNTLIATFRTYGAEEDLGIKRLLYGLKSSDVHVDTLFGMYQLTLGLYALNNSPLPSHLDAGGDFSEDLFEAKFKKLRRYPMPLIASLGLNFKWFDERSRRLFIDVDPIKNG